jgi:hypothetical protein
MLQSLFLVQDNRKIRDINNLIYNRYFKEKEILLGNEGFIFFHFHHLLLLLIHKLGTQIFFKFLSLIENANTN